MTRGARRDREGLLMRVLFLCYGSWLAIAGVITTITMPAMAQWSFRVGWMLFAAGMAVLAIASLAPWLRQRVVEFRYARWFLAKRQRKLAEQESRRQRSVITAHRPATLPTLDGSSAGQCKAPESAP
jgi:hypothetical protein